MHMHMHMHIRMHMHMHAVCTHLCGYDHIYVHVILV